MKKSTETNIFGQRKAAYKFIFRHEFSQIILKLK